MSSKPPSAAGHNPSRGRSDDDVELVRALQEVFPNGEKFDESRVRRAASDRSPRVAKAIEYLGLTGDLGSRTNRGFGERRTVADRRAGERRAEVDRRIEQKLKELDGCVVDEYVFLRVHEGRCQIVPAARKAAA